MRGKTYSICLGICLGVLILPSFSQREEQRGLGGISTIKDPGAETRARALIMGVSRYNYLPQLNYAVNDADDFAYYLRINPYFKINPKKIVLLTDSLVTRSRIMGELEKIYYDTTSNLIIIYFAGHGDIDDVINEGFLLGYDCIKNPYSGSDVLQISTLEKYVNSFVNPSQKDVERGVAKPKKVILVTDACRSGNLKGQAEGAKSTMNAFVSYFKNVIKFLSCKPGELSQERNFGEYGNGVFTHYLLEGLYGLADENKDNKITLREIEKYVKDTVFKYTSEKQNPELEYPEAQTIISTVDSIQKQMAINRKSQAVPYTDYMAKRANEPVILDDTVANRLKNLFFDHVRKGQLIKPDGRNAYSVLLTIKDSLKEDELYTDLKYELIAQLENDAQRVINNYLRGEDYESIQKNSEKKDSGALEKRFYYTSTKYLDAADKLEVAVSLIDKSSIRYRSTLARYFFLRNFDYRTAWKERKNNLLKADSLLPDRPFILYALGRLFSMDENPDFNLSLSTQYCQKALELNPSWVYPRLTIANNYTDLNKEDSAINICRILIKQDSLFWRPYVMLGYIYHAKKNNYQEAKKWFFKAYQLFPENSIILNNLGAIYGNVNKNDSMMYFYNRSIEANEPSYLPFSNLIYEYLEDGNDSLAKSIVARYEKISSSNDEKYWRIGNWYLYRFKDYVLAKDYLNKSLQFDSDYRNALLDLAQVNKELYKYDSALYYYRRLISLYPTFTEYYNYLGNFYYGQKIEHDSARFYYLKCLSLDSTFVWAHHNLSLVYRYRKSPNIDSAIHYLLKGIAINPRYTDLYDRLYEIYRDENKKDSLTLLLTNAHAKDPLNVYFLNKIADFYKEDSNSKKAILFYKKSVAVDQDQSKPYLGLADVYASMGKMDSSIYFLKQGIKTNPENKELIKSLAFIYFDKESYDSTFSYFKKIYKKEDLFDMYENGLNYKEYAQILKYYRKIMNSTADYDSILLVKMGDLFFGIDSYDSALYYYTRFQEKYKNIKNPEVKQNMAEIYEEREQYDLANKLYLEVIESGPVKKLVYYKLAQIQEKHVKDEELAFRNYWKYVFPAESPNIDYLYSYDDYYDEGKARRTTAIQFIDKYLLRKKQMDQYIGFFRNLINNSIGEYSSEFGYFEKLLAGYHAAGRTDSVTVYQRIQDIIENEISEKMSIAAEYYYYLNDFPIAKKLCKDALILETEIGKYFSNYTVDTAFAAKLALCYLKMNLPDSAAFYIIKTYVPENKDISDKEYSFEMYFARACYYAKMNNRKSAVDYLKKMALHSNSTYLYDMDDRKKQLKKVINEKLLQSLSETEEFRQLVRAYDEIIDSGSSD